jgi:hypothetical protein
MRVPLIAVVGWAFYGKRLDTFVLLGALDHRLRRIVESAYRGRANIELTLA